MPWYWSDDLADILLQNEQPVSDVIYSMKSSPVAFRHDAETIEEAAGELAEDGEIPLAA